MFGFTPKELFKVEKLIKRAKSSAKIYLPTEHFGHYHCAEQELLAKYFYA